MKDIAIRIPDETVDYLQRLDFELTGLKVLHTHALNAELPLEKRMEIRRAYQEQFLEFQLAKQELWAQFEQKYQGAHWRLDYGNGLLYIEVNGNA